MKAEQCIGVRDMNRKKTKASGQTKAAAKGGMFSFLNLGQRFSATLVLFLVLPLILVSAFVSYVLSDIDYRKECETRLAMLEQTAVNVEMFAKDMAFVTKNILGDDETQNLFNEYRSDSLNASEKEWVRYRFNVNDLLESRDHIKSICLYDDQGIIYQYGARVNAEDMDYYEDVCALGGSAYWTPAYLFSDPMPYFHVYVENEYVVSIMRVINDLYQVGHRLGIERISVAEEYICGLFDVLNTNGGSMTLLRGDGSVISSTDKSLLGTVSPLLEPGYTQNRDEACFAVRVADTDWQLVLREAKSALMKTQQKILLLTLLSICLTLVFGIVFLFIQHRSIIRPLRMLSREARHFRDGSLQIQSPVEGTDEIAQLGSAMNEMGVYINNLIERELKAKISQREMELEYLQGQINPHFLYNTLDSIRWMAVIHRQPEIAAQLEAMSQLFRHSLNYGEKYTTLAEEVHHLEQYMQIMQMRFADSISFKIDVDESLLSCRMIKLILQPLVENAVVHGIEPGRGQGHVSVSIDRFEGKLRCRVTDDGIGIDAEDIRKYISGEKDAKRSFALKNIYDRLHLEYGEGYGLSFTGIPNKGTEMQVLLPVEMMEE